MRLTELPLSWLFGHFEKNQSGKNSSNFFLKIERICQKTSRICQLKTIFFICSIGQEKSENIAPKHFFHLTQENLKENLEEFQENLNESLKNSRFLNWFSMQKMSKKACLSFHPMLRILLQCKEGDQIAALISRKLSILTLD